MTDTSGKVGSSAFLANLPERGGVAWLGAAVARVRVALLLKLFGTPLFLAVFFVGYFWSLRHPLFASTLMPVTMLDRLVGFHAAALPLYLTLWLYVSLPPGLMADRRELLAYGAVIGTMCLVALGIFVLWPTAVPPDVLDDRSGAAMGLLRGVDATGNACPSLHVAAAFFSGIWLDRLLRRIGAPSGVRWINWAWCAAIVYSTMATKQHVAYDVLGGLVLGFLAAIAGLRVPALASYGTRASGGAGRCVLP